MTKPDFIIIGAMKSATSTLHAQLALQPGIFMSTPKEPNYFSDDIQYERGASWYDDLFAEAGATDICGESSTHYTKLPDYPETITRMHKRLQQPKLIYVMRHPVDRLVSHYIHQWSQNIFKCDINEAIERYPELVNYSCYAMQLEPYIKAFGTAQILLTSTEAIRVKPQQELERVANFIGYRRNAVWQDDLDSQNVSQQRIRRFYGYDLLIDSKWMTALRRHLIPQSLRNRVKSQFTMNKRPQIDLSHQQQIQDIFNTDLAKLGQWLDISLNCDNFAEVMIQTDIELTVAKV